jgi:hypothetical protein
MRLKIKSKLLVVFLVCGMLASPHMVRAQQSAPQSDDGAFFLGSFLLSVLYFPIKLATCVGTQATAAVAYTATYGVAGNYDGGTNGKDIGEVARRSCTGSWIIPPEQVKKDYQ